MPKTSKPNIEDSLNLISQGRLDLLRTMADAYRDEVMELLQEEQSSEDDEAEEDAA